jgi:polyhydroxybutyrate depolymerase
MLAGLALLSALAIAAPAAGQNQTACGGPEPCALTLPDGTTAQYYVREPTDWDGSARLPLIVWFHGYGGAGSNEIANDGLVTDWTEAGYLFVAGDGATNSWAHQGSPSQERDDIAYVEMLVDALFARYPIDRDRVVASGFSQGGSMVWSVACFIGAPFTHYAPIAGAFWEPAPPACPTDAVVLRHTHGLSDGVVPMAGRPIGERWHQADVRRGMATLAAANQCAGPAGQAEDGFGQTECTGWTGCASGQLELCLHEGGHSVPAGWTDATQAWIAQTAESANRSN